MMPTAQCEETKATKVHATPGQGKLNQQERKHMDAMEEVRRQLCRPMNDTGKVTSGAPVMEKDQCQHWQQINVVAKNHVPRVPAKRYHEKTCIKSATS